MPWIKVIEEEQATGELAQLYEEMKEPWGSVARRSLMWKRSDSDLFVGYSSRKLSPIVPRARPRLPPTATTSPLEPPPITA